MRKFIGKGKCICDNPHIRAAFLNKFELELTHQQNVYLRQLGGLSVSTRICPTDPERHLRFASYSRLTLMIHGTLGMSKRVELPSCLVKIIRANYPNKNGSYTGFRDAFHEDQ
uniref:P2X purinoreceptor 7 intracellular domain-containing protein n=1 Tax=Panagrolaimus superbus TaxID=310955 RepID=A0A914Y8C6_9BILA